MQLSCARHLRVPRLAAGAAWHNPMVTPDVRQWNRTKGLHSAHPDSAQISGLTGRSQRAQRTPEWPGCARFLADCCPTPGMTIAYSATLVQMEWADPLWPFSSTSMDLRH